MVRVLLGHNRYQQPGGEGVIFHQEAELLRQNGHEVIEYERSNDEVKDWALPQKAALPFRMAYSKRSYSEISAIIAEHKPDIAHFQNTHFVITPSAYLACKEAGVPVVQTLHNYRLICPDSTFFREGRPCEDCLQKKFPWPGIRHACYRDSRILTASVAIAQNWHRWRGTWKNQVAQFIVNTEFSKSKFIQWGLSERQISVKPNFLANDPGPNSSKDPFLLFVGRLTEEKGVRTILSTLKQGLPLPLKMVGQGPLQTEVQDAAHRFPELDYLGQIAHEEVVSLVSRATALIIPSLWYEGLPMTLMEALACSTPVVASRLGALEEVLTTELNALHFKPGDPVGLKVCVERIHQEPGLAGELGTNGRALYETKFSKSVNYERIREIYRRAVPNAQKLSHPPLKK